MPDETKEERFGRLYADYYKPVLRFIAKSIERANAEELTQDLFFRVSQYEGPIDHESSFIWRSAHHAVINEIRRIEMKRARLPEVSLETLPLIAETLPADGGAASLETELQARHARLTAALQTFTPLNQECLRLYSLGLKYRDIAASAGLTENAVKARLRDARARLRMLLGETLEGGDGDDHET